MSEELTTSLLEPPLVDTAIQYALNRNSSLLNIDQEKVFKLYHSEIGFRI